MKRRHRIVVTQPKVLSIRISSLEEVFGNMLHNLLRDLTIKGGKFIDKIAVLMLNVGHSSRIYLLMVEEILKRSLFLVRLNEILPTNAISKAIRGQRYRLGAAFLSIAEIMRISPSFKDIIALQHIRNYAGNVLGEILLMEPQRIESYFVPRNAVDLSWQPQLSRFDYPVLQGRMEMRAGYDAFIDSTFSSFDEVVDEETIFRMGVIPFVQIFRTAVTVHC